MTDHKLDTGNPLWRGLSEAEAGRVSAMFLPASFAAGETLVRQGPPSDHAVIVRSGAVEVLRELPGGQSVRLGEMGPGAVIGELGLLADANRLASVVAAAPTTAGVISGSAFRAGLELLDPALLIVARNILSVMSERLREQSARIAESSTAEAVSPSAGAEAWPVVGASVIDQGFAWRAFAPILPAFRSFRPADLSAFLEELTAEELPKGGVIAAPGAPADRAYFVLRGAAAALYEKDGVKLALNILGPGELCGASNLVAGQASDLEYVAREGAVLMGLPADRLRQLLARDDALGLGLVRAVAWSLARGFARSNNTLGNFSRIERVAAA